MFFVAFQCIWLSYLSIIAKEKRKIEKNLWDKVTNHPIYHPYTSAFVVVQRMETQTAHADKWECYYKKQGAEQDGFIGAIATSLWFSSFNTFVCFVLYFYFG